MPARRVAPRASFGSPCAWRARQQSGGCQCCSHSGVQASDSTAASHPVSPSPGAMLSTAWPGSVPGTGERTCSANQHQEGTTRRTRPWQPEGLSAKGHAGWGLQERATVPLGRGQGPRAPARWNPRMMAPSGSDPLCQRKGNNGAVSGMHKASTRPYPCWRGCALSLRPPARRYAQVRRGTSASSGALPSAKSTATPSQLPQELKPQLRMAASVARHARTTRQSTGCHCALLGRHRSRQPIWTPVHWKGQSRNRRGLTPGV